MCCFQLLATKDWTSLVVRCQTMIDLRIPRHATSSASDRTLRPTRPATHRMSPLSARTSPAAETAESNHHASRHLHDAPSFTPSVRLMKTQTATEWGRFLQWLWGTVTNWWQGMCCFQLRSSALSESLFSKHSKAYLRHSEE